MNKEFLIEQMYFNITSTLYIPIEIRKSFGIIRDTKIIAVKDLDPALNNNFADF